MTSQPQSESAPAAAPTRQTVNIGIRASLLPQIQSPHVLGALRQQWPDKRFVIHTIGSLGGAEEEDMTPLHDFDDKSLWQHELETMLEEGEVDVVFNKVKDIPFTTSNDRNISSIIAVLPRADPTSVLVLSPSTPSTTTGAILPNLPANSPIGATSPLRLAQLRRLHPHLSPHLLRGKPAALLHRLDGPTSSLTALVLGGASLARAGLNSRAAGQHNSTATASDEVQAQDSARIDQPLQLQLLHAVGQGLLGALVRSDDVASAALLAPLADAPAALSCTAERALARSLVAGGCGGLIGVSTTFTASGPELALRALATSRDGTQAVEGMETRQVATPVEAEALGGEVAAGMLRSGADALLETVSMDSGSVEARGKAVV